MSLQARVNVQTVRERDRSKRTRRDTENRDKLTKAIDAWDPNKDPQVTYQAPGVRAGRVSRPAAQGRTICSLRLCCAHCR